LCGDSNLDPNRLPLYPYFAVRFLVFDGLNDVLCGLICLIDMYLACFSYFDVGNDINIDLGLN